MRIAAISDIHGNLEALSNTLKYLKKQEINQILCGGDIVGYYPDPVACVRLIQTHALKVIAGNHDVTVTKENSKFRREIEWYNPYAAQALSWTRKTLEKDRKAWNYLESLRYQDFVEIAGKKLFMVHGSPDKPIEEYVSYGGRSDYRTRARMNNWLKTKNCDVLLLGHTHVPFIFHSKKTGGIVLNPGSIGQPRDGDPRSAFAIIDIDESRSIKPEILIKRLDYNIEVTRKKVQEVGLPSFLGSRLYEGR
ncbi:MAG: metallophosphoesterase family protein [Candidatus Hodarchaeota archaeon]